MACPKALDTCIDVVLRETGLLSAYLEPDIFRAPMQGLTAAILIKGSGINGAGSTPKEDRSQSEVPGCSSGLDSPASSTLLGV